MKNFKKLLNLLEWSKINQNVVAACESNLGKKRAENVVFSNSTDEIKKNLNLTSEAKNIVNKQLPIPTMAMFDITEHLQRVEMFQSLDCEEILEVATTIKTSRLLKYFFARNIDLTPLLNKLSENLFENHELEEEIFSKFDENSEIKDDATPELRRLRTSLKDHQYNLKSNLNGFLKTHSNYLQESVYTLRGDRYVFPIKIEHKAHVKGITHDVSTSGATIFVEPNQIVELSNKIKEIEIKIENEIKKILAELSAKIVPYTNEIKYSLGILSEIDYALAKGKYSLKINGIEPKLNTNKYLAIKEMKHPLLIEILDKVVPNDVIIGKNYNCLVITGSNTGGKTVILKTLAVCILMAKAGMHIPAYEADIYPFSKIFADIGDEQSLAQSLSTFSSHMTNIREIIDNADENSLILLDEIGAGTDPQEGASLAQAILEHIQNINATSIVTTHYGELKALKYLKNGFENASVQFDVETLKPTYKLIIGIPGKSNAITIAQNLGLKESIIKNAQEIYITQKDPTGKVLEGLQNTHQQLSEDAETIKTTKENLENLESEYNEKLEKLTGEKKKTINIYKKKYDGQLQLAKDEIKAILNELRHNKSEKLARRAQNRLSKIENVLKDDINNDYEQTEPTYEACDWANASIGDSVFVKDLNKNATLISMPDKNNKVEIQLGELRTKVKTSKLFKAQEKANVKENKFTKSKGFKFDRVTVSSTLDLRGYRVEDALDETDKYLDDASLAGLNQVTIIHGHGTGALKQAIREYLNDSPYVAKHRPGNDSEGSDGVSIVDLV